MSFVFTPVFFNKTSFSVITYQVENNAQSKYNLKKLQNDNVFYGEFQSKDNNLGLIVLALNPHHIPDTTRGEVIFRFKEKGKAAWDVQKGYDLGLFDSQSDFSFGFPIIPYSKNKRYQFELSLISDDKTSNLFLKRTDQFITGYQYPKARILNLSQIVPFIFSKTVGFFSESGNIIKLCLTVCLFGLFLLVVYVSQHFLIIKKDGLYSLLHKIKRFKYIWSSKTTFVICLIFIILWLLLMPFGMQDLQKQLNMYVYSLFLLGCAQLFFEIK